MCQPSPDSILPGLLFACVVDGLPAVHAGLPATAVVYQSTAGTPRACDSPPPKTPSPARDMRACMPVRTCLRALLATGPHQRRYQVCNHVRGEEAGDRAAAAHGPGARGQPGEHSGCQVSTAAAKPLVDMCARRACYLCQVTSGYSYLCQASHDVHTPGRDVLLAWGVCIRANVHSCMRTRTRVCMCVVCTAAGPVPCRMSSLSR